VPSPICSSFSKQSTLREPHDGASSRLSWPGTATAMGAGTRGGGATTLLPNQVGYDWALESRLSRSLVWCVARRLPDGGAGLLGYGGAGAGRGRGRGRGLVA
jgi:hypothetical protein